MSSIEPRRRRAFNLVQECGIPYPQAPAPPAAIPSASPARERRVRWSTMPLPWIGLALVACFLPMPVAAQQNELVVRQLSFEGNQALPDEVLSSAIGTTNSSWFARAFFFRSLGLGAKRYFDEQEFRRDVVRMEVLYRRSGYPDAVIDTIVRRTPVDVYITFRIQEGDPILVTSMAITGLDSLPIRLRRAIALDLPL
jgi:hypothetical protein